MNDVAKVQPSPMNRTKARPEKLTFSTTTKVMEQLAALTHEHQCSAAELIERMIRETREYGLRCDPASVKREQRKREREEYERLSLNTARGDGYAEGCPRFQPTGRHSEPASLPLVR